MPDMPATARCAPHTRRRPPLVPHMPRRHLPGPARSSLRRPLRSRHLPAQRLILGLPFMPRRPLLATEACLPCPLGSYGTAGAAICSPCAENSYLPTQGYSACVACPPGSYSLPAASACRCALINPFFTFPSYAPAPAQFLPRRLGHPLARLCHLPSRPRRNRLPLPALPTQLHRLRPRRHRLRGVRRCGLHALSSRLSLPLVPAERRGQRLPQLLAGRVRHRRRPRLQPPVQRRHVHPARRRHQPRRLPELCRGHLRRTILLPAVPVLHRRPARRRDRALVPCQGRLLPALALPGPGGGLKVYDLLHAPDTIGDSKAV